MNVPGTQLPLPPTSSLPPLRSLDGLAQERVLAALRNLHAIYCPLPTATTFHLLGKTGVNKDVIASGTSTPGVPDSGYVSGDDGSDDGHVEDASDALETLRADAFEREFAMRWLTGFIARAEGLGIWSSEEVCESAVGRASGVIASFLGCSVGDNGQEDEEDEGMTRIFSFARGNGNRYGTGDARGTMIEVKLLDKPIGTGADHTDVGLQSWGASIVFSDLVCASPERFGLEAARLGGSPRIVELGAGTGLVALTLAKLLPALGVTGAKVVATDYHPAVLENLRFNVEKNFSAQAKLPVETCLLDWAAPSTEPPLDERADLVMATDVVYAPEHALWLRGCVTELLAPQGVFWLMATVRQDGKFEGIEYSVEKAFGASNDLPRTDDGQVLKIFTSNMVEKRSGIGRGDEKGYKLYEIGWAAA